MVEDGASHTLSAQASVVVSSSVSQSGWAYELAKMDQTHIVVRTEPPSQLGFNLYFPPVNFSNLPLLYAFCSAWLALGRKLVCRGYREAIHVNKSFGATPSASPWSRSASTIISSYDGRSSPVGGGG